MLSRKQQWRIACGRTRHVTARGGHHAKRLPGDTAGDCGDNNNTPVSPLHKVDNLSTPAAAKESGNQKEQWCYYSTEAVLPAPLARSTATEAAKGPWGNRGVEGETKSMNRRSVCFNKNIRVILVPTRHELKGKGAEGQGKDSDAEDDQGIWWSLQECFEFRKAYRRQILKLGLTQCKTLLCPATVVFLCDEEENDSNNNDDNSSSSNAGGGNKCTNQMAHEDIATATATATAVAARMGCPVVEEVIG